MFRRDLFWSLIFLAGCAALCSAIFCLDVTAAARQSELAGQTITLRNGRTWYVVEEWEAGSWLVEETQPSGATWRFAVEEADILAALAGDYPPVVDPR